MLAEDISQVGQMPPPVYEFVTPSPTTYSTPACQHVNIADRGDPPRVQRMSGVDPNILTKTNTPLRMMDFEEYMLLVGS